MYNQVIFNSRDPRFKEPTGAVCSDTEVRFLVYVGAGLLAEEAVLAVRFDKDGGTAWYGMSRATAGEFTSFTVSVRIHDTGLYWYWFRVKTQDGWVNVRKSARGNRVEIYEEDGGLPWLQSVYRRRYKVPEWIEGGVFYHIFVDRFAASGERVEMPGKVNRTDWGGIPEYRPTPDGKVMNNDFFGGNLKGITEKLSYLEDLGVTCLFLSPIFKAYSNHKYDTEDYMSIDPMFGSEEDLKRLCEEAGRRGIRVILDGVFSHTGSDSLYFDRENRYGNGAYAHPDSPYRDWYYIHDDGTYETWWGIETLPRMNKDHPGWKAFICGEDGVARRWLRDGVSGWRLDVADELPNHFLESIAEAVKAEKPDALLIGEVWEDASTKISYSERKNYFEGDKLDAVMNYPFRTAILEYFRGGEASLLQERISDLIENDPPEVMACMMNMLGTHDTVRILTALGHYPLPDYPTKADLAGLALSPEERGNAVHRLKMAVALNMTLPGVPCIFYGDEAGVEGFEDPFCRACFPWDSIDEELHDWYRRIIRIRRSHEVYKRGGYRNVAAFEGLFAFERYVAQSTCAAAPRMVTALNVGERENTIILSGMWVDQLTGSQYSENITVLPGEVLLLEEQPAPEQEQ